VRRLKLKKISMVLFALGALGIVACATEPAVYKKIVWNNKMHRLSTAMSNLVPYASDPAQFFDENNREFVGSELAELGDASAELARDSEGQSNPLLQYESKQFAQEMAYARSNFDRGNSQVARFLVSNVAAHCINCHTSMDRGTQDFPMTWAADMKSLSSIQKTQMFLANRQYKSAVAEANKLAADKKSVAADPEGWRQSIERTLAMLVRVENNVGETMKLVRAVNENPGLPGYIKRDASFWQRDASLWRRADNKKVSPSEKYNLAVGLIKDGKTLLTPQSHSALISNLRASVLLQELIQKPKFKNYPESLYYAGVTSELLPGLVPWSVSEYYYELCIRAKPGTLVSMNCFTQLEASVNSRAASFEFDPDMRDLQAKRLLQLRAAAENRPPIEFEGPEDIKR